MCDVWTGLLCQKCGREIYRRDYFPAIVPLCPHCQAKDAVKISRPKQGAKEK